MAFWYVRSTDGSDADTGATWALAKATIAGALAVAAAGDTIYVSHQHAESSGSAISWNWPSNVTSPIRVICVNDGAEPPTALAATATVTTTAGNISITGGGDYVYFYGITFTAGSGSAAAAAIITLSTLVVAEACNFHIATTAANQTMQFTAGLNRFISCGFKFAAATQRIFPAPGAFAEYVGCSLLSGGTSPTNLFNLSNDGSRVSVQGFDLTNASAGVNISTGSGTGSDFLIRNSKLPVSWSGSMFSGTPATGQRVRMINCDSGDTNYKYQSAEQFGTVLQETTLTRTSGGSDGTTPLSFKLVSNANAEFPMLTLDSPPITKRITSVGSPITLKAQTLRDNATPIKDNEAWLEVEYLGTSGFPIASFISDGISVMATGANQGASSVTWTTTGMSNPDKREFSVTFTPQEVGMAVGRIRHAKASDTMYVCGEFDQS